MNEGLLRILEMVRVARGIDFSDYKESSIFRRVQRRLSDTKCTSYEEYLDLLDREPAEYDRLLAMIYINVTGFFRDSGVFDCIRRSVLPRLFDNDRRDVKIWCAGCASGEEPYSIAILLAEYLGEHSKDYRINIFATDVDEETIAEARAGEYTSESLKDVDSSLINRYFTREWGSERYKIKPVIREMVLFGTQNLAIDPPISKLDLLLCRNVLIYFSRELQARLFPHFAFALKRGGFLVLGKSENIEHETKNLFQEINEEWRIYRKL